MKKTIKDIPKNAKRILLRVDLNVPVENGIVNDDTRIKAILPTIKALQQKLCQIILCSHFGRPSNGFEQKYSLQNLIPKLEEVLEQKIYFINSPKDLNAQDAIYLLENTRFNEGETKNSDEFAQELAKYGDIYINDAFSASHRAHSSTQAITKYLPSFMGLALEKELNTLEIALEKPERPLTAIVGGAKVSTKIDLLYNLIEKVDNLIIGGGMANSFLAATNIKIGTSLYEVDVLKKAKEILNKAAKLNCNIILPIDAIVAKKFNVSASTNIRLITDINNDEMILDVGSKTIEKIKSIIDNSKTIIWNGPVGAFELKAFSHGTIAIAKYLAQQTQNKQIISVAGGGDTIYALAMADVCDKFTFVSTAGGAFLEWMEGKNLPAIAALE